MRDRPRVLERADTFNALLAADARRLHAAKRCAQIEAGGNVVQRQGATFRYEMLQPDLRTGEPTLTTEGSVGAFP